MGLNQSPDPFHSSLWHTLYSSVSDQLDLLSVECEDKEKPSRIKVKKLPQESRAAALKPQRAESKKPKKSAPKAKPIGKASLAAGQGHRAETTLTRVLQGGHFQQAGDTVTARAGETLELRCKGRSVGWRYPAYLLEDDEGRLRIKHFDKHSQLMVVNSTAADTGEYSCGSYQCKGGNCQEGQDRIGKTFIFFTDPQDLFVPTEDYYEVVQMRTNQPTRLPCQVTNPLAKVTLHREFPPEEVPVNGVEISFDVKKGFIIYRPRPLYAGSLFCMAELNGLRQISTKYMLIYVNYPSSAPKATIKASESSIHIGDNFIVTCTVLGEPEINVDFTWDYPGQQMGRPPYVRESTDLVRRGGQVQQESQSMLYVDEVRAVDEGTYTCNAQNLQGTTSVSTRVTVRPPNLLKRRAQFSR
ncbi:platelet-derived growth factor receptor-like protein isoform X2 [Rhinatrema bivittatum]|uniref:platelet-derived growth factor receptor-like protein isoform X2 n=1 Tax=Rhinatrema bivittatum TaxID=194408 RepID=UPI00112A6265|nr:platelet-derived growth factor receptor-like protein isoform X2 [Rhinatrema bivittatum]